MTRTRAKKRRDGRERKRRLQDELAKPVVCGECGSPMELRFSGKYERKFWGCTKFPKCKGTHGAHPDGRPLGVPANKETKNARIVAHDAFDELWKLRGWDRNAAYKWLREVLCMTKEECHIGKFDIGQCARVVEAVASKMAEAAA